MRLFCPLVLFFFISIQRTHNHAYVLILFKQEWRCPGLPRWLNFLRQISTLTIRKIFDIQVLNGCAERVESLWGALHSTIILEFLDSIIVPWTVVTLPCGSVFLLNSISPPTRSSETRKFNIWWSALHSLQNRGRLYSNHLVSSLSSPA